MQREGPNLCFYWQALYETEISHFEKKPKIDENRRKIAPTGLQGPAVRKNIDFFAPGGGSMSILIASVHSRTPRGTPKVFFFQKDIFGDSPGTPGTARVALEAPPSRSRHALGDLRASQEGPGIDFDSNLDAPESPGIGFTPIFALSLLGKPLENSPRTRRNIL